MDKPMPRMGKIDFRKMEAHKSMLTDMYKRYLQDIEIHSANHVKPKTAWMKLFGLPSIDPANIVDVPFFFRDEEF